MATTIPKVKKHKKVKVEELEDEVEDIDREALEGDMIRPSKGGA